MLALGIEGQPVWFGVESDGYSYPANPLGGPGVALTVVGGAPDTHLLPPQACTIH